MPSKGAKNSKAIGEPTVQFMDLTDTVKARRVVIPPGGIVEPYRVGTGYVVFPFSNGIAKLRKTTYRDGKVLKVEDLVIEPDQPFYVAGFKPGTTVSMENMGSQPVIFGKRPVNPPPKTGWPPPRPQPHKKAAAKRTR